MISLLHVSKTYRLKKRSPSVHALKDVSFDLPDSGMVFVLGKSGSGKSTLLHLLGGLDTPTSGEILVDGKKMDSFSEKERDAYRNSYVGFIFQSYNLLPEYDVEQNVSFALSLQGEKPDKEQIYTLLRKLELVDENGNTMAKRKVSTLSGGQKQRVAIARALIKHPKMVLADEPTGALDQENGDAFFRLLKEISKDHLVVVVTHDKESAEKFADRILQLKNGEVIEDRVIQQAEKKENVVFEAKPPRFPFKETLHLGWTGLFLKPWRFFLTLLITALSFSLFGFSYTCLEFNSLDSELETAYRYGCHSVLLHTSGVEKSTVYETDGSSHTYTGELYLDGFASEQIFAMEKAGVAILPLYPNYNEQPFVTSLEDFYGADSINGYELFALKQAFQSYIEVDPNTGFQDTGLSLDSRIHVPMHLPSNDEEIAITSFQADALLRYGLKQEEEEKHFSSLDELIGTKLYGKTIEAVIDDKESKAKLNSFDRSYPIYQWVEIPHTPSETEISSDYTHWYRGHHPMTYFFLKKGYTERNVSEKEKKNVYSYYYAPSGNRSEDIKSIKSGAITTKGETVDSEKRKVIKEQIYSVSLSDEMSGYEADNSFLDLVSGNGFRYAFLAISIALLAFSFLVLLNFLLFTIDARKREMDVLRSLGASRRELFSICLSESLMFSLFSGVISLLILFIGYELYNHSNGFYLFLFRYPLSLILIGLCLLSAFVASFPLLARTMKNKK